MTEKIILYLIFTPIFDLDENTDPKSKHRIIPSIDIPHMHGT
jgi:hypothetical protein